MACGRRGRPRPWDAYTVFPLASLSKPIAFLYQPVGENAFGPRAVTFTMGADREAVSVTVVNPDLNGKGSFVRATA